MEVTLGVPKMEVSADGALIEGVVGLAGKKSARTTRKETCASQMKVTSDDALIEDVAELAGPRPHQPLARGRVHRR